MIRVFGQEKHRKKCEFGIRLLKAAVQLLGEGREEAMTLTNLRTRIVAIAFALALCPGLLEARGPRDPAPLRTRTAEARTIEYGLASGCGPGCRWHRTASGTLYDDQKLTAAHRSLPLGTMVRVTNLKNGRSVVVKVNDRGPWVRTRLIDLSRAAAVRLGFRHQGLARVKLRVIHKPTAEHSRTTPTEDLEVSAGPGK